VKWARRNRWQQASYYLNCRRLIAGRRLTFQDAVELVRKPKVFADYLLHRYANPSFLADVALLPFLGAFLDSTASARGSTPCRVLDLACGAGHSSFLIQHWFPESSVVSVDQDFVSLYLSKRFLAPLADYVCTDVEAPSPFPALHFDAVHCLDAFHYFRSKRAIVTELRRVAKTGALWLFPHLHNALEENVTAGIPLSPENYARCFEFLRPMLFDEADLLRHVCDDGFTTRRAAKSLSDLSKAQTVALVAGGAVDTLPGQDLSSWICRKRSSLRINPIYKSRWTGTTLRLELHWPNDVLHRECQAVESILPRTCEVTRNELDLLLNGDLSADHELVRRLVCRFVLVPLPSGYSRHDPTSTVMFH
jgi:SAM-dependent methyltransferase